METGHILPVIVTKQERDTPMVQLKDLTELTLNDYWKEAKGKTSGKGSEGADTEICETIDRGGLRRANSRAIRSRQVSVESSAWRAPEWSPAAHALLT
jgi:hypothetical protein